MEFGRNSNRRFAVKNKEIKQIIFSRKKNKKWIIIALVLVLTLGGGSVAAVTAAVLALKCRAVEEALPSPIWAEDPEEVPAAVCPVVPAGEWISADFSDSDRRKRAKP